MIEQIKPQGNYDEESGRLLLATEAEMVVIIVINGSKGNGFSVSALGTSQSVMDSNVPKLPPMLRDVAKSIEEQLEQQRKQ